MNCSHASISARRKRHGCFRAKMWTFCININCPLQRMFTRACLHGDGGPQIGEVTCGRSPHLTCKRDQIKIRDYKNRRVTPPQWVTSPTWGAPPPWKQALRVACMLRLWLHNQITIGFLLSWKVRRLAHLGLNLCGAISVDRYIKANERLKVRGNCSTEFFVDDIIFD